MVDLERLFKLNKCVNWIKDGQFKRIVLQFPPNNLKYSADIVAYLKGQLDLDVYITQNNTCCVDLIIEQHVSGVDAIIRMGMDCISYPEIKRNHHPDQKRIPILFTFGQDEDEEQLKLKIDAISQHITSLNREGRTKLTKDENFRILVLYDNDLITYAAELSRRQSTHTDDLAKIFDHSCLTIARLDWLENSQRNVDHTFDRDSTMFTKLGFHPEKSLGQYHIPGGRENFSCTIYLGKHMPIPLALECPGELYRIDCHDNLELDKINRSRLLNKRIAIVERLREEEELRVGVIITNPLPDIPSLMNRLEGYAKPRKHTLYFISMIQTIDECKIGNFDLCDAFVVVNSCNCSRILESLVFNRPIITELEFKLACGFEAEYGRVNWPGSDSHLSADDMINKRRVSDVSLALNHTRNELLERCSQARANKWSGLDYKATGDGSIEGGKMENLNVEKGLEGIASSYLSEPLKRLVNLNLEDDDADCGSAIGGRNDDNCKGGPCGSNDHDDDSIATVGESKKGDDGGEKEESNNE